MWFVIFFFHASRLNIKNVTIEISVQLMDIGCRQNMCKESATNEPIYLSLITPSIFAIIVHVLDLLLYNSEYKVYFDLKWKNHFSIKSISFGSHGKSLPSLG